MHHTISYHLAQARIAALRQHAQRGALARAAGRPGRRRRPSRRRRPGPSPWALRRPGAVPGIAQAAQPAAASDASAR